MNSRSLLVRMFGWRAALIHGGPSTLDRWLWLSRRLPAINDGSFLLDVGCGTGAFTIGTSFRGYQSLGLSWDKRDQEMATERAKMCSAHGARFSIQDVRRLSEREDLKGHFDVAICCEVIEHVLNDAKLMQDIAACLKPGGQLLLTTPNVDYRPITPEDAGPFCTSETGWHVRKGYTAEDLTQLCQLAGLKMEAISFCSGFVSQKATLIYRVAGRLNPLFGWAVSLPLRILPLFLDGMVTRWLKWPEYSICLEARKSSMALSKSL